MNAQDLMTKDVLSVDVMTTVAQAAEILQTMPIRHLPVLEGFSLAGIISDRDLKDVYLGGLSDEGESTAESRFADPVTTIMTPDVVKVDPEASLKEITSLLLEHRVGALPVVDPLTGDLMGIISYVDVLRALAEDMAD